MGCTACRSMSPGDSGPLWDQIRCFESAIANLIRSGSQRPDESPRADLMTLLALQVRKWTAPAESAGSAMRPRAMIKPRIARARIRMVISMVSE
jgi:hypothetical protein